MLKKLGIALGAFGMAIVLFLLVPKSAFTMWLGVVGAQERVVAAHNAAFWKIRSLIAPRTGVTMSEPVYGQIVGLTKEGEVVLRVSQGNRWVGMAQPLAGIEIRDRYRAANHLRSLRDTTAKIDVYRSSVGRSGSAVVVWVHGQPVNLVLVEDGLARPEMRPETSVTDAAYAAYYWRVARGADGLPAPHEEPSLRMESHR